jgi:hypothetical protein
MVEYVVQCEGFLEEMTEVHRRAYSQVKSEARLVMDIYIRCRQIEARQPSTLPGAIW